MKLHMVFATDGLPFDGNTIKETALGGSESALFYMAREMARRGHRVDVFCNCPKPGVYDGVIYYHTNQVNLYGPSLHPDVLIVSRFMQFFRTPLKGKLNVLWNHDILADPLQYLAFSSLIDRMYNLSKYHIGQYMDYFKDPVEAKIKDLFKQTRNGIDFSIVPDLDEVEKDENLYLYTSRPERGLPDLLKMWPEIKRINPKAVLGVCNYKTLDDPKVKKLWKSCRAYMERFPSIKYLGQMPKHELYQLLARAKAVLYPTAFPEISCISAIEAQACGTPILTTNDFALSETVIPDMRIDGKLRDKTYRKKFLEKFNKLQTVGFYEDVRTKGINHAKKYSWELIAGEWEKDFISCFETRVRDNPEGMYVSGDAPVLSEDAVQALLPMMAKLCREKTMISVRSDLPGLDGLVGRMKEELPQMKVLTEQKTGVAAVSICLLGVRPRWNLGDNEANCWIISNKLCDALDIQNMFAAIPGRQMGFVPVSRDDGYWLVSYIHKDGHDVDFPGIEERKELTNRPHQGIHLRMIVKDAEEDIARCLMSVKPHVDTMGVFVDETTSDDTAKIAEEWGASVTLIKSAREIGFGPARNESLKDVPEGDWVLWLDSDEVLHGGANIQKYLHTKFHECYIILQHQVVWQGPKLPPEKHTRLFRKGKNWEFRNLIHEQPSPYENKSAPSMTILPDVSIIHYGYVFESVRREKCQFRNLPLLLRELKENPDRKLNWFFLLRNYLNAANWLSEGYGTLDHPNVKMFLQHAIKVYDCVFKDDEESIYHDMAFDQYQNAMNMLDIGMPVNAAFQIGKPGSNGSNLPTVATMRFRDFDEVENFMARRLGEAKKDLQGATY